MANFIPPSIRHSVHTVVKSAVESITSVPTGSSQFLENGTLTPEDFVKAGDYLVETCPTWQWKKSSARETRKKYLPEEKQYLATRNVPCRKRAKAMEEYCGKEVALSGEDEGWVEAGNKEAPSSRRADGDDDDLDDDDDDGEGGNGEGEDGVVDEIPDISRVNVEDNDRDDDNDDDDDDDESIPDMEDVDEDDAILIAAPKKEKNCNERARRVCETHLCLIFDIFDFTPVKLHTHDGFMKERRRHDIISPLSLSLSFSSFSILKRSLRIINLFSFLSFSFSLRLLFFAGFSVFVVFFFFFISSLPHPSSHDWRQRHRRWKPYWTRRFVRRVRNRYRSNLL